MLDIYTILFILLYLKFYFSLCKQFRYNLYLFYMVKNLTNLKTINKKLLIFKNSIITTIKT